VVESGRHVLLDVVAIDCRRTKRNAMVVANETSGRNVKCAEGNVRCAMENDHRVRCAMENGHRVWCAVGNGRRVTCAVENGRRVTVVTESGCYESDRIEMFLVAIVSVTWIVIEIVSEIENVDVRRNAA
jgi:hypothetical protein